MENCEIDIDEIISKLLEPKYSDPKTNLTEHEIKVLCLQSREIFLAQPTLLELTAPLKICGDIHGHYIDLLRIFELGGFPPVSNYLFLGNYIDRGNQSLKTICLLLAYKIKYPNNFYLLRGNHECASINRIYSFYDDCKHRYTIQLWKAFNICFNCLPFAAIVNNKIFCVHAGLSSELSNMEQIRSIVRPIDIPDSGFITDLLWSCPDDNLKGWDNNSVGVSYDFGKDIVKNFLRAHNLEIICRGHQIVDKGYKFFADKKLVSIFSATNYCGEYENIGAFMSVDERLVCSFYILKAIQAKFRNELQKLEEQIEIVFGMKLN